MNQIELVTGLPNWQWKPHSQEELTITGEELVQMSDTVWRVGNAAVAGFIYHSFTNPPWMWFLLAENVNIGDLVDFRRIARLIPSGTTTAVAADFALALRFAKLYGFEDTGETQNYSDREYKIMRKM